MSKLRALILCAAALAGRGQTVQDPVPIARTALNFLVAGNYSELRAMFNAQMLSAASEDTLRQKVGPQFAALGKPESIGSPLIQNVQNVKAVVFPGKFASGSFNIVISVDNAGKVAGLFLEPAQSKSSQQAVWTRPAYSDPATFRERPVTSCYRSFPSSWNADCACRSRPAPRRGSPARIGSERSR